MSTFAKIITQQSYEPERTIVLGVNSYCADWNPKVEICLGLRRYSDRDVQTARAEAMKTALELHDDYQGQVEAFNDALMRWLILRGTCDPNDIRLNAPVFEGIDENVRLALTPQAIRFIWDHLERYHIEASPLVKEIDEEETKELVKRLQDDPKVDEKFPPGARKRFKKLLAFCLNELREMDEEYDFEAALEDAIEDDDT